MSASWFEERWARLRSRIGLAEDERNPVELCLTATCVLLSQNRSVGYLSILLGICGLVYRPLRRTAAFWLVVAVVLAGFNYENWWNIDNHKYLINYWALALGVSFLTSEPEKAIAWNGRILIGLAFLLAAVQKVVSGDFFDGTFFHFLLLEGQPRFQPLTEWVGGLSHDTVQQNYHAIEDMLMRYDSGATVAQLQGTPRILWMAKGMTWWTGGVEVLVAVTFLWPLDRGISKWRDFALLAFLFTTYVVAQVVLFGWVLAAMGMSQCESRFPFVRFLYVVAFLAIVAYTVPPAMLPWGPQ